LQELVTNINTANTNRVRWLYDNVNLPAMVNYLAVMIIIHDNDAPHKNYWMYRDSDGTREWQMLPWDKDLSFGMNFNGGLSDVLWATNDGSGIISPSHPFFADQRHQKVDLQWNRLVEAMYITPPILEMFKRRLRSVMDLLLQSPGTWPTQRRFEQHMDYMYELMKDDVALDRARWPYAFGAQMDFLTGLNALKDGYLTQRRLHLYLNHSVHNAAYSKSALLPDPQPDDAVLLVGELDYNPVSGKQDEEYVQVLNTNAFAADISGWHLTGGGITHTFAPGTVIPSNSVLYLSPNAAAFRARTTGPRGGQTNFVQGNYRGHLTAQGDALQLTDMRGRVIHSRPYAGSPSAAQRYLRVTELMYHPAPPPAGSPYTADDFEYIELKNLGPATLNLAGLRFTAGVQFDFSGSAVPQLGPGQQLLLVKNLPAFTSRYGAVGAPIAGQYLGNLDNSGETLRLEDAVGEVIFEFSYDNRWLPLTDGFGFSLAIVREDADERDWNRPEQWRLSETSQGGPGIEDALTQQVPPVYLNEVFSASTAPLRDAVEVYNPGPAPADLSGWWLTDDYNTPRKYRLPPGSVVAPGGYLVLDEAQFNATPGVPPSFSFSSSGDEAYLFAADSDGNLLGYFDGFHFGAAENGVSFGRYVNSVGEVLAVPQTSRTLGGTNTGPQFGPLIVSEIHYHPPELALDADNTADEFVELLNVTTAEQFLYDPQAPTNRWRLRGGIDFEFPAGFSLPPGGIALVVSFAPESSPEALQTFKQRFTPPVGTPIFGPFRGRLQNSSDRVELQKPNPPVAGVTAYVTIDEVTYDDQPPWPPEADGLGLSLQRRPLSFANDPGAWFAAVPTAGTHAPPGGAVPVLRLLPAGQTVQALSDVSLEVTADGPGPLHYQWRRDSVPIPGALSARLQLTNIQPQQAGPYDVVVFNNAGSVISPVAELVVQTPPVIAVQPSDQVVLAGSNVSLVVHAFGTGLVRYQWRRDGSDVPGATNNVLSFDNAQEAQTGTYSVQVTDVVGTLVSQSARLAVVRAPSISSSLPPQFTAVAGDTVQLGIMADGTFPLNYRWRRNGVIVTNQVLFARNSILVLSNVQSAQAGVYSVNITNLAPTSAQSGGCTLTVLADADGDHIADAWELAFGFSTNNAADAMLDTDGDGVSNFDEFRAGTDPNNPASYLRMELTDGRPNAVTLQFGAGSNRTYSVQFAEQRGEPWLSLTNVFSRSTNWKASVTDPSPAATARFYRLVTPYQP
jgi:hypothetical protein